MTPVINRPQTGDNRWDAGVQEDPPDTDDPFSIYQLSRGPIARSQNDDTSAIESVASDLQRQEHPVVALLRIWCQLEHLATTFTTGHFVVIHFGGIYGFAQALPLVHSLPNVYLETSTAFVQVVQSPLRAQLHFLVQIRLNKLIFGTEHSRDYARVVAAIDDLTRDAKNDVKNAIYRGNAARILGLA